MNNKNWSAIMGRHLKKGASWVKGSRCSLELGEESYCNGGGISDPIPFYEEIKKRRKIK